jgi:hypothetical protein
LYGGWRRVVWQALLQGNAHSFSTLKALSGFLLHGFNDDLLYWTDESSIYLNGAQARILLIDAANCGCLDRIRLAVGEQVIHGSTERVDVGAGIGLH